MNKQNNENLDVHKKYLDLGFKVSEIIESRGLEGIKKISKKIDILQYGKDNAIIQEYLIYPTQNVPKSVENTEYFNRSNLDGLFTVYVLENKKIESIDELKSLLNKIEINELKGDAEDKAFYLNDLLRKNGIESHILTKKSIVNNLHPYIEFEIDGHTYTLDSTTKDFDKK